MPRLPIPGSSRWAFAVATGLPLLALLLFFAWPVGAMLARGLGSGALAVLAEERSWRLVGTTLWLALAGTAGSVLLGLPGAWILHVCRFPGQRLLRAVATIPFVLPTVVVGIAFRFLLGHGGPYAGLGLDGTPAAIIAAMVFFNFSVIVRTVGTMWASLDPRMAEAAQMLGAGPVRVFLTVTLPALRGAIASGASLVFLFCASAYGLVMTLGGLSTLESEIWTQSNLLDFDAAAGLSLLQFLIVILALGLSSVAARGTPQRLRRATPRPLRRRDLPALLLTLGVVLGLIIAPLLSLLLRSFRQGEQWTLDNYRLLASTGKGFSGGSTVLEALQNSLATALQASVLALAIGVPLALALSRPWRHPHTRRLQSLIETLAMAPLGVSAVTLGFGFLIALQAPPLRMGSELVPIAQAMVAMPMVLRALLPILRAINPRLRDAAALLGASPARILCTIDLPMAWRGLRLAIGFAFAMSLGEFGAASFLATGDDITLPVLIARLLGRPGAHNYGMAMAASVILGAVTATIMALCENQPETSRPAGTVTTPTARASRSLDAPRTNRPMTRANPDAGATDAA
ncbi:MAG: iron ABC transporter permease [Lautropia sp.]|nr:iron ABC transporter permease [Lautropia sp.]